MTTCPEIVVKLAENLVLKFHFLLLYLMQTVTECGLQALVDIVWRIGMSLCQKSKPHKSAVTNHLAIMRSSIAVKMLTHNIAHLRITQWSRSHEISIFVPSGRIDNYRKLQCDVPISLLDIFYRQGVKHVRPYTGETQNTLQLIDIIFKLQTGPNVVSSVSHITFFVLYCRHFYRGGAYCTLISQHFL